MSQLLFSTQMYNMGIDKMPANGSQLLHSKKILIFEEDVVVIIKIMIAC